MQQELKGNGWSEYEKLVLFRLTSIETRLAQIDARITSIESTVGLLKFKLALIGSAAGLFGGAVITGVVQWMTS
jgi:hypothetical protein